MLNIKKAFERSKVILNHVNQAVREAEDELRLSGIQKKLDAAPFEKVDHPLSFEYKVPLSTICFIELIINQYKLVLNYIG